MFDHVTRAFLEHLTSNPPPIEHRWYAPWARILETLFPCTQNYSVAPQHFIHGDEQNHVPDFGVRLLLQPDPLQTRTVLIVEIKNSQDWQDGIPSLEGPMKRLTVAAFSRTALGTAISKVY